MTYYRMAVFLTFPKGKDSRRIPNVSYQVLRPFQKPTKWVGYHLYKIRPVTAEDLREFAIREGDGNLGCFGKGTVMAYDVDHAIAVAKREGRLLCYKRNVEWDGDDVHCYGAVYSSRLDYAPYCCEITDVEKAAAFHKTLAVAS